MTGNNSSNNVQLKAYNVTTTWSEAFVDWFNPWTNNGGDYTTSNAGNASTIPALTTGWHTIDLTAPFLARYPASMSDFLDKGFLLKYSTTPSSGDKVTITSKEWSTTSERWYIEVTYAEVQSVVITDAGTYTPDRLYADGNGDRKRTIEATIDPPVGGVEVDFEVADPDDPADNTNIDGSSFGVDNVNDSLTLSTASNITNSTYTKISATTNSSGVAQATLDITNKVGGNNYVVRASVSGTAVSSDEMIVWRKLKIEYDVMEDTPAGYTDYGPQGSPDPSHVINQNYLSGLQRGQRVIFEADYNDGQYKNDRNTFTTPIIIANEAPPNSSRTSFVEKLTSSGLLNYSSNNRFYDSTNGNYQHLTSAHLFERDPWVSPGVGGHADNNGPTKEFLFLFWDKLQYDNATIDGGELDNFWILAHEFGHNFWRNHHTSHGQDDVAGASGHDCIMTQAPGLNTNGQLTKRFGPQCVREIRNRVSNTAGIE